MHKISLLILFLSSFKAMAFDASGLQISLAGDMVYEQGINKSSVAEDKLKMRGAEMMFYAPIDHRFDGTLSAAAHDENGETVFELHELYLSSNKIIPRSRFKIGQYFLGVGVLNPTHQHDWAFIRAPKVHETFFDSEGVFDSGIEFGTLLPTSFYLDFTIGITSGHRYGHAHTAGSKPKVPTHYLRLESFKELSKSTDGLKFGINYLGRTDEQSNKMSLAGFDIVGKWREGKRLRYLLQSEAWYRSTEDSSGQENNQTGLYIFNQIGISTASLLGLRLDGFKDLSKINTITKKKVNNISYGASLEYTWVSSEFTKFRPGLSHEFTREEGRTTGKDTRFQLQFIFVLGAHPAHNF